MKWKLLSAILLIALFLTPALGASEIHDAALAGDMAKVKALLEKDPALLNAKGRNDKAPIHWAAQGGHLELVAFLIAKGAPVDSRNIKNETPLVYAAEGGFVDLVKFLMGKGADVNVRSTDDATPVFYTRGAHMAEVVKLLAAKGANVLEKQRDGSTLLYSAAQNGSLELVKFLLDKGLPADAKNDSGETPLFWAVVSGNADVVKWLVSKGANPLEKQSDGSTLLHMAAQRGSPELVKFLLAKGLPAGAKTDSGDTPLLYSVTNGNKEVTTLLLNAGANADSADKKTGRTVLHLAAAKGYGEICSLLMAKGASVNPSDNNGETPLVLAKRYGNNAIAAALTAKGATAGTAQAKPEPDAGMGRPLAEGQAVVWYLGHSGWAVLTRGHLLIFDYWKTGALPDEPSLANGTISAAELKDVAATVPVTVFVSHSHGDHYVPAIWEWRKAVPNIAYVLGFEPREKEAYSLFKPHEKAELNGLEIIPIESNDSGQGFFVKADGVSIFHSGDHANRQRDFSGPFKKEIDFLADAGLKADIFFAPVSGCGFGDPVSVKKGVYYTIDRLSARALFPMHGGGNETVYATFARDAKNAGYDLPVCVAEFNGDRFAVTAKDVKGAYTCPQNCADKK